MWRYFKNVKKWKPKKGQIWRFKFDFIYDHDGNLNKKIKKFQSIYRVISRSLKKDKLGKRFKIVRLSCSRCLYIVANIKLKLNSSNRNERKRIVRGCTRTDQLWCEVVRNEWGTFASYGEIQKTRIETNGEYICHGCNRLASHFCSMTIARLLDET
jgi:hypothetical protein